MIGCSVLSLLEQGVDEVLLVDCGSSDESLQGLARLREAGWPVTVISDPKGVFRQAALTNLLWQVAADRGADWTIPFDADEFFLVEGGGSLREVLEDADPSAPVRYRVRNFVVSSGKQSFQPTDLADVAWVAKERGAYWEGSNVPKPEAVEATSRGDLPFVCAHFPSKIILPSPIASSSWLIEGSHKLSHYEGPLTDSAAIVMAHLPFRSQAAAAARASAARELVESEDVTHPPLTMAFQRRQIATAEPDGQGGMTVDDWWRLNSAPEGGDPERFEPDDRLAERARTLLPMFDSELGQAPEGPAAGPSQPEPVTASDLVRAAARAGRAIEAISMNLADRVRELEVEVHEGAIASQSLEQRLEASDRALAEIRGSRAWRATKPLRSLSAWASSALGRRRGG